MRILLSIERAASQPRDGAYMPETIDALVSPKQPLKLTTKCIFSFPLSCSTSWGSGSQCRPSFPTAPSPTTAQAWRTIWSRTSPGSPPSSPAPQNAKTSPSASTSPTTWTGTGTTRAPATSSPPARCKGPQTGSGCRQPRLASPRSQRFQDILEIAPHGIVYSWPHGVKSRILKKGIRYRRGIFQVTNLFENHEDQKWKKKEVSLK